MNTTFLLMAQFNSVTLTMGQVCALLDKRPQTIRNRMALGTFPRATDDGIWRVQDVADHLEEAMAIATAHPHDDVSWMFGDLPELVTKAKAAALPCRKPIVYLLMQGDEVVYVGKSVSRITRLYQHWSLSDKEFDRVATIKCDALDQAQLETSLIAMLRPRYNIQGVPKDA